MSTPGVLHVVGFLAEAALLPRGARVLVSGADPARLDAALAREAPAPLLCLGIGGGLAPGLREGSIVVGSRVVTPCGTIAADPAWTARLAATFLGSAVAPLAGSDRAVADPAARAALFAATDALVVDMESHVVARHARRMGVPFALLRVVADTAEDTLPRAALAGLDAQGRVAPFAVLRALARRPWELPALVTVARRSRAALRVLAQSVPRIPAPP